MPVRVVFMRTFLLGATSALISVTVPHFAPPVWAACVLVPGIGNDTFVCDSGASVAGLTDLNGDNTLTMPPGGSGVINGDVIFGAGADRLEIYSGEIRGAVNQGAGADTFVIGGGTVTGNVQQGTGIDDFRITGGQILSLNQGDALDTFFMSGGRIVDFFDDGDYAVMTGGRIGRVNMKLDKNYFNMSDGIIDRNLVTGFDQDTIIVSGGIIGGNISVSGGNDSVTVTGGTIDGSVLLSFGNDTFNWDGGGIIYGAIDLGGDNDIATIANLTDAHIGATKQINGGANVDQITLNNVKTGQVSRFTNWESIHLTNDTRLVFDETLTLGDSGTGAGSLSIDAASTIYGGNAQSGVSAFNSGQLARVLNAGRIDLTNGGDSTSDVFAIQGDYIGDNGLVFLDTVLGDDSSASDKLVISGGNAAGTTGLNILNSGGAGATTQQNGIMVIEAINGGTTSSGAFALNNRVAAGAYEYYLFKGGVSDNTGENWYLRSTLVAGLEPAPAPDPVSPALPQPEPEAPETVAPPPPLVRPVAPLPFDPDDPNPVDPSPPVQPGAVAPVAPPEPPPAEPVDPPAPPPVPPLTQAPVPVPGTTSTPPTPDATPVVAEVINLYRIEVPTYAAAQPVASHLALSTLGTFHERRGDQSLLQGSVYLPTTWSRVFGQSSEMKWDGTVAPSFDGSLYGIQAGQDLFGWSSATDHQNRIGLLFGYTDVKGDVKGQALGWNDLAVGEIDVNGTSFGGYWTHVGPQGWYLDAVLMGTWFNGEATSRGNVGIDIEGTGVTASLEGGYPLLLNEQWTLEPQAQLIWNHLSLDNQHDEYSSVSFDDSDGFTGRLGMRLHGRYQTQAGLLQPYLKLNLWHNFSSDQTVRFNDDPITTEIEGTTLEFGGGIIADLTEQLSLFATADYATNVSGERTRIFEGNVGLSVKW